MATRVWLVRHAEPAEAIGVDPDLTGLGFSQAAALVDVLAPCALVSSPLRRARSTAQALADAWSVAVRVDATYRELPSPTTSLPERREWLRWAMTSTFADLGDEVQQWRRDILAAIGALGEDTVIVTHALVINATVGSCVGDDRVLHLRPAHAAVTALEVHGGVISLVEGGREAESVIG